MPSLPFRIMGSGDKSRRNTTAVYPGNRSTTTSSITSTTTTTSSLASNQASIILNQRGAPLIASSPQAPSATSLPGPPQRTGMAMSGGGGLNSDSFRQPPSLHPQTSSSSFSYNSNPHQQQHQQQYQAQQSHLHPLPVPPPPLPQQQPPQRSLTERYAALDTSICTTASAPARVGIHPTPAIGTAPSDSNNNTNSTQNQPLPSVRVDPTRNPVFRGTPVSSHTSGSLSVAGTIHSNAASTGGMPNQVVSNLPGGISSYTNSSSMIIPNGGEANASMSVASAPPTNSITTSQQQAKPGAFQVTRTSNGPAQVYRVTVPAGVRPGSEFTVHAGPRRVRVRCPASSRPGQSLQITLPPETVTNYLQLKSAPLTAATGEGGGGSVPMTQDVLRVNDQAAQAGGSAQTYLVTIPPNIYPGMQFTVNVGGQRFMVNCPDSAGPNMRVRIVPPVQREEPEAAPKTQVFEVAVPQGVQPGQPFALVANGQRVLVTCPPNVVPGQKIRFQLPVSQVIGNIQLAYESEKGGWRRTIRVSDLKFQWVRLDGNKEDKKNPASHSIETVESSSSAHIDIDEMEKFDFSRAAYVRKITFLEGNDARMRTGYVELVAAHEAVVDSRLIVHNRTLLSYADIAVQQTKPFTEKQLWFDSICKQLTTPWEDGHIKVCIRRSHLLQDSVDAIMGLGRDDMRKLWRIEFLGEPAIDAGGPAREWFELVTEQIFDPACGLWISSINNQACVDINPGSALSCPDDHLVYYRFAGRTLGRALFDRQLIKGHMVRMIYKHLLGWPVTIEDIKAQDEEYYHSLKKLMKLEDVSAMCLDFTATEENMGMRTEKELVDGGALKEVTNENLQEYLEANIRYRIFTRVKDQLTELMLGFFDVVPEPALTVFDANELELMLCGLPEINMVDWKMNTRYKGMFEFIGANHEVVKWFWDIVEFDFDQEMRARLLQFATGTSGVPARGFNSLQGIDGNIKKFTIQGVDPDMYMFPKSHTCFNRIDLPVYRTRDELKEKLTIAITTSFIGFDTE